MTLRDKLIVLRDKAGVSQMALANRLGVSRQAVSRWESGDTTPSIDKLKALAKLYDVSLDWLCSDANDTANEQQREVTRAEICEVDTGKKEESANNTNRFAPMIIGIIIVVLMLIALRFFAGKKQNGIPDTWARDMEQDESYSSEDGGFAFDW